MITRRFTGSADAAARRYGLLVEAWRGIYNRGIQDSRFGSQKLIAVSTSEAYELARAYLANERVFIDAELDMIAADARSVARDALGIETALDPEAAQGELVSASVDYLQRELSIQIERDVAWLINSLRKTHLAVSMAARATGVSFRAALMEHLVGHSSELQFFFHDRRNQKFPSLKFVRSTWRHSLLTLWNESALLVFADHGVDHVEVHHDDPNSTVDGMKLALFAASAHPSYDEIRNEIFHPNADAVVGLVRL